MQEKELKDTGVNNNVQVFRPPITLRATAFVGSKVSKVLYG